MKNTSVLFLDNFLGVSREGVSIENPKEVKFAYDKTERILRAQAKKPLIIVNKKTRLYNRIQTHDFLCRS